MPRNWPISSTGSWMHSTRRRPGRAGKICNEV
jgi:hypothetical protein